jgi:dolichyl-phosphate-mannose--protein O-mannosyl transferase
MTGPAPRDIWRACALLIALGTATHLVGLTYPREIVFDEATSGNFVSAYCCTRERIVDVHPPHGKLLIALGAKLGGYQGDFKPRRLARRTETSRFRPAVRASARAFSFLRCSCSC